MVAGDRPVNRAVVLGGADTLWSDLAQVNDVGERIVVATNDAGVSYRGRIDYWCTLHPEKMARWMDQRRGNQGYATVSTKEHKGARIDRVVREIWRGSSGLYATQFAVRDLGCADVILCGVPMTVTGHFFNGRPWEYATRYRRGWKEALPEIQGRVTSLSGWTRDLLGPPA